MSGSDLNGLGEFVRDRGNQFSQRTQPINMCQICFELSQSLALLFCTLAIFNVRQGSVPFNNIPMSTPKGYPTHQKPPIFAVRGATESRLVFENLSGCNRNAPLLGVANKVVGM